ncbi:hypothetical protein GCM10010123_28080 [Pilimelia anulata]|uniref:Uncharacterized protein n=1 Tax=Pilimelia anulata TaxID=53371 RepID=A0A8J3B590_9ACTN|nr:hypothetical protein [Pilimelia anulata]GGJ96484.1 hypothetical protein GCM10010123_28080 [Pilimelia anulata]
MRTRARLAAGIMGVALLVPSAAPAGAAAPDDKPVGTWSGTVSTGDGQIAVKMGLTGNGKLCLIAPPPGPNGGTEGSGTWKSTGKNKFRFQLTERYYGPGKKLTGSLRATHNANQRGSKFTSTGTATFYDASGHELGSGDVASDMKRTSNSANC